MDTITPRIVAVRALKDYYIYIKFINGEEKVYNMEKCIKEIKYYEKLKERKYFEKIRPRGCTIEWQNGEDVCPENLYYESISYSEFIN